MENTATREFIVPYYIKELGEEGLNLQDISSSLGITHEEAKKALERNLGDYEAVRVIVKKTSLDEIFPQELSTYALKIEDAVIFLSVGSRVRSKAYRRIIVKHELGKTASAVAKANELLKGYLVTAEILGLDKDAARVNSLVHVKKTTGVDLLPILVQGHDNSGLVAPSKEVEPSLEEKLLTPEEPSLEEKLLTPEELSLEEKLLTPEEFWPLLYLKGTTAANRLLRQAGLQKNVDGAWKPTEKAAGLYLAEEVIEGDKTKTIIKWDILKLPKYLNPFLYPYWSFNR